MRGTPARVADRSCCAGGSDRVVREAVGDDPLSRHGQPQAVKRCTSVRRDRHVGTEAAEDKMDSHPAPNMVAAGGADTTYQR